MTAPAFSNMFEITPRLLAVLADVPDPEIPAISLIDLGIVRNVETGPAGEIRVVITPTYTGCPATQVIEASIRKSLDDAGFSAVEIRSQLSPPWTTDWITDQGRENLLAYGIAPPERGDGRGSLAVETAAACPQCRSTNTVEVSRFGSTPCKALWRCRACAEPFDRFKCI
ncbi:1,2-phenylacetyl-CoA epoxidase subunit PaaD [Brevundimonas sp.]|uniref:1,2-phenylacetyl-CoA epoxidase subunit PaaD n=1 Tax=Brevundimonas sp. TaxID=1871086 RepID=UPI003AFF665E